MPNTEPRLVRRGIFSPPWLDADGRQVLVAVDSQGRAAAQLSLQSGELVAEAAVGLRELLDIVDPS